MSPQTLPLSFHTGIEDYETAMNRMFDFENISYKYEIT